MLLGLGWGTLIFIYLVIAGIFKLLEKIPKSQAEKDAEDKAAWRKVFEELRKKD